MRLLVVEDERRLAEALKWGLEAHGFEVDVRHDGLEAVQAAETNVYAAILLDLQLPGLSGYRVCAEIRRTGNDVPILMLTAKSGEYDEVEGLDTGADDYLTKPFSYVVLVARLRALLRRTGQAPTQVVVGDLVVDGAARRCSRAGQRIVLTDREFAVLEFLGEHRETVVTRREILEQVWGWDFVGQENTVEVHISALRRKIDQPFGRHSLQTVRGVGYRLSGQDE
ncbi:response regulator transcription factor [Kribbella sp. NPDC056861]|uniref:response regulator transcription factor n=1 Tax=Kribbella sp. NPDC056861 TaxID=3154857 RepID=UPI0034245180